MEVIYIYYVLFGTLAGFVAGLLGVGGGLIIVPLLAMSFAAQGFVDSVIMHLAVGTSLATIVFTSISSIWAHHRHGAVRWHEFMRLAPGIVTGAWMGAALANILPTTMLSTVFGVFELYVAIQMTLNIKPKPHRRLPEYLGMFGVGNVIGGVSAVVGVGGGTLTVPFLVWCNVSIREAIATSAACGLPIALSGSMGFVISGWSEYNLPVYSLGYLHLPALIGIVAASVVVAPLGAKWAHRLPAHRLKQVFAIVLYILAAYMLLGI
ncbi:MAG: sulfite exporter TauE/SafE family protein [Gammaproteobacteria bacterium]|nr:sulfite exporter TauE/SafE family protein [Gammaproteobacteria bacterium]